MKAHEIHWLSAKMAARCACGLPTDDPAMQRMKSDFENVPRQLYDYCRDRSFPAPETIARRWGQMIARPFPFARLADAPEPVRIFFTVYRALAQVLEPWREPDDETPDVPVELAAWASPAVHHAFGELDLSVAFALMDDGDGPLELLKSVATSDVEEMAHHILGCSRNAAEILQSFAAQMLGRFPAEESADDGVENDAAGSAAGGEGGGADAPKKPARKARRATKTTPNT